MDFRELSYVLAIAENQSITKAANSLHLSQPTLTIFLHQLESSLGQKLFDRVGKKMVLTYAGKRYTEKATQILAIHRDLQNELMNIADVKSGQLRIGISSVRGSDVILKVIPTFSRLYPHVQLQFREIDANSFENLLLCGDLDIAFFNLPIQSPNIEYQILSYDEVILVSSQDHPLNKMALRRTGCRYPWIDLQWAKNETFIMLSNELRMHSIIADLLHTAKITPKVSFYTKNLEAACILASEGYGLAFSGEQYIKHTKFNQPPAIFSIGNPCTRRTFAAAMRKGAYLPNYAQQLINLLKTSDV